MGAGLLLVCPKYKLRKHGCAHNHITPDMKRRTQSFNFLKMTSAFRTNNMKSSFLLIMFLLTGKNYNYGFITDIRDREICYCILSK